MSKRSSYVFSNNGYLEKFKLVAIMGTLRGTKEVQEDAADPLGVTPRVLNYKIQILEIDGKAFWEAMMDEKYMGPRRAQFNS